MANISLWMPSFSFFLSKTIKPGHGQHLLVRCLHCLYICLHILHWWHCNGFQRVQAKRGTVWSGWVGAETALNSGAPTMQIKPGKFNIFFFSWLQSDGMHLSHASVYASIFSKKDLHFFTSSSMKVEGVRKCHKSRSPKIWNICVFFCKN